MIDQINKSKSQSFEKINKIDKTLGDSIKKKRMSTNLQISNDNRE